MTAEHDDAFGDLRDAIRAALDARGDEILADLKHGQRDRVRDILRQHAAELGWFGIGIAEDMGGLGLGVAGNGVLYEELGRACAPLEVLGPLLVADLLQRAGSTAQQRSWLPRIASGELQVAVAMPLAGLSEVVETDEGLSGTCRHVLGDVDADLLAVPFTTNVGGVHMALVCAGDARVEIVHEEPIDLTRSMCAVKFTRAQVSAERRVAVPVEVWNALLDHASVAIALDSVGGGFRVLERTVEYMQQRVQFGRPIGSFQALKHRAATWKVQLEGVRALAIAAASLVSADDGGTDAAASAAKSAATDVFTAVAGDSIQLHGGIGFTWEHECHLFMKRSRLNAALFGTALQHRERVATAAFSRRVEAGLAERSILAVPKESRA